MYSRPRRTSVPTSPDEVISPEANNRRLRQTIRYVESRGGSDTDEEYIERINTIKDYVIDQYAVEGYDFDPELWRVAKRLVEDELELLGDEPFEVIELSSDSEVEEELEGPQALYRRASGIPSGRKDSAVEMVKPTREAHPISHKQPSASAAGVPPAIVRETQFRYGGPNNDVEVWHKENPPILPFGETLLMQELESLRINHDLRESARKMKENSDEPVVHTSVPFEEAEKSLGKLQGRYDSGSRFKLPRFNGSNLEWMDAHPDVCNLKNVVADFNTKGWEHQAGRDYAPRTFLEQVEINSLHGTDTAARRRSSASVRASGAGSSAAGPSGTYRSSGPSSRKGKESAISSARGPHTGSTGRKRTLSEATPSGRRWSGAGTSDPKRATIQTRATRPETPGPKSGVTVRRLSHIAPSPPGSRGRGRPPHAPPKPAVSKRKLADADDSYEEASSRSKRSRTTGNKHVAFDISILDDISDEMENNSLYDGGPNDPLWYDEWYTGPPNRRKGSVTKATERPAARSTPTSSSTAISGSKPKGTPGPKPKAKPGPKPKAKSAPTVKEKPGPKPKAKPGPKPKGGPSTTPIAEPPTQDEPRKAIAIMGKRSGASVKRAALRTPTRITRSREPSLNDTPSKSTAKTTPTPKAASKPAAKKVTTGRVTKPKKAPSKPVAALPSPSASPRPRRSFKKSAADYESVKRGITRSGLKFKNKV